VRCAGVQAGASTRDEHFEAFFAEYDDEMAPRQPRPHQIGATQAPEFASEELESVHVQLAGLDARFELEDVRVCSASLVKVDAGSGRVGRVHLKDVGSRRVQAPSRRLRRCHR